MDATLNGMIQSRNNLANMNESRIMAKKIYPKGSTLFKQGDNSRELYILNSGALEVIVDNHTVATISQRGSFFGELAAILDEPRNATIKAKMDCDCIAIPTKYVESVITAKPEIGLNLIRILAKRLKKTTNNLAIRTSQYMNEILKTRKLEEKLTSGDNDDNSSVYDVMIQLKVITKEQLEKAKNKKNAENSDTSLANILIEMNAAPMGDILDIIKIYSKSVNK